VADADWRAQALEWCVFAVIVVWCFVALVWI